MNLSLGLFLTLLLVAGIFMIVGYVFLQGKKYAKASLVAGYIILLFIGLWVLIDGLYYPTGVTTVNETSTTVGNVTTTSSVMTDTLTSNSLINYAVGLTTILLSMLGLAIGTAINDEED